MVEQLEALKRAGITVFSVAVSNIVAERDARSISSLPRLANVNYFLSPAIANLTSFSGPLAAQVLRVQNTFACLIIRAVWSAETYESTSFNSDFEYSNDLINTPCLNWNDAKIHIRLNTTQLYRNVCHFNHID